MRTFLFCLWLQELSLTRLCIKIRSREAFLNLDLLSRLTSCWPSDSPSTGLGSSCPHRTGSSVLQGSTSSKLMKRSMRWNQNWSAFRSGFTWVQRSKGSQSHQVCWLVVPFSLGLSDVNGLMLPLNKFFNLPSLSLNTGLCEHAISWQGPVSILAVPFSFKLLTVVYAGYESETAANFLYRHFSIIIRALMLLSLEVLFFSYFLPLKTQGGLAILSMKFEHVV